VLILARSEVSISFKVFTYFLINFLATVSLSSPGLASAQATVSPFTSIGSKADKFLSYI
jgi:hypothetical protein